MKARHIYEFYDQDPFKPKLVWELENTLAVCIGDEISLKEFSHSPQIVHKVEHHLEELAGLVICKTYIRCH